MITLRDLVQRLASRNPGAWSVAERVQDIAFADEHRGLRRREHRTRFTLIIHHDVPLGRGTARLDVDAYDGSADELIDQAIATALAAIGAAWAASPAAAPAKVAVVDDGILQRELDAVVDTTLARLRRPPHLKVTLALEVLRETTTVIASSGLHASWPSTTLRADATLTLASPRTAPTLGLAPTAPRSLHLTRHARRLDDLDLDTALADAAADLVLLSTAGPATSTVSTIPAVSAAPGPCALWLGPEAILHDGDLGLWSVFAHQADSAIERRGLTRYRWRAELHPGASQLPDPLSITSNGALDFATRSTPVTDDAVAIRQFPLVERGIATGLGLSPREAALRRTDPNGGVRNLIVAPGTWSPAASPTTRTLEIRRLHAASIDLTTGHASLDIALGLEHLPDRATPTPFTGGTLHLDLLATLARARRSPTLLRRGAYHGPAHLLIDDAELIS